MGGAWYITSCLPPMFLIAFSDVRRFQRVIPPAISRTQFPGLLTPSPTPPSTRRPETSTTLNPVQDEPVAPTKKARSKKSGAGKKATAGTTDKDDIVAEPGRRGGRRKPIAEVTEEEAVAAEPVRRGGHRKPA